jgi:exonuclease III
MRIVTWNMGYWGHSKAHEAAWQWLLEKQRPDIAFLQECVPPIWAYEHGTLRFERAFPDNNRQRWGTALFTRVPSTVAELPELAAWLESIRRPDVVCSAARLSGWCVASSATLLADSETLLISLHNPFFPIARQLLVGRDIGAMRLKHNKDLWLLDVVFYFLKSYLQQGQNLLVGGDFNYSRLLDDPKPRGNAEFFDRLAAEGFVSLHRLFHGTDQQTFFNSRSREHQLDYLYADPRLADLVADCFVVSHEEVAVLSDHAPLVAELRSPAH